jgi:hypothetical protein
MKRLFLVALIVAVVTLGLTVPGGPAAPALADKPVRYEFGELRYLRGGQPRANPFGGGLGQPGAPAGKQPAPAPAPQPAAQLSARWTTTDDEIEGKNWEELADKLKAPAAKKEGSVTIHKLRILNKLCADGWEMLDHQVPEDVSNQVWAFRRRLP